MSSEQRQVLAETLVREGVGLLMMAAVLWYLGPGRDWIAMRLGQLDRIRNARQDQIDVEVARFRHDMSEWEHEQAQG